jgi:Fic family protein
MNCYYSNLIEGHDTHPVDIERALREDYSQDARRRDLQLEARAHIAVQKWTDEGGLKGRAVTTDGIRETHRRFCESCPKTCSSSRTRTPMNASASSPANCGSVMSRSDATSPS